MRRENNILKKYDFKPGDYVEDRDGNVGYIDFICDCSECRRRGWLEPHVIYPRYDSDYIYRYEMEEPEKYYRRIGKYQFKNNLDNVVFKTIDGITLTGITDEDKPYKVTIRNYDNRSAELCAENNNGKKSLTIKINGNWEMACESC